MKVLLVEKTINSKLEELEEASLGRLDLGRVLDVLPSDDARLKGEKYLDNMSLGRTKTRMKGSDDVLILEGKMPNYRHQLCRLEICQDRQDRRSCKIFPNCVKFWGNNANSLGNYRVIYALNE